MGRLRKDAHLLKNLIVFEAVTRARNFTEAAAELGMSRVAVSRQIAELEAALDLVLFRREHRRVTLTDVGRSFAASVVPGLERIEEALERHRDRAQSNRVSVTATAAFATYWLMPRLSEFGTAHPDVEINLVVSDRYLDLAAEGIDVAIRYLPESPEPGLTPLFCETVVPVFSPNYKARTTLRSVDDLHEERLLHLSGRYRAEARWAQWFEEMGCAAPSARGGIEVNKYMNMLQAAIEGQGIALAGHPLIDRFLANGSLQTLPGIKPSPRLDYYLIVTSDSSSTSEFATWLRKQR